MEALAAMGAMVGSTVGGNLGAAAATAGTGAAEGGMLSGLIDAGITSGASPGLTGSLVTMVNESPFMTSALGGPITQQGVGRTIGSGLGSMAGGSLPSLLGMSKGGGASGPVPAQLSPGRAGGAIPRTFKAEQFVVPQGQGQQRQGLPMTIEEFLRQIRRR